MTTTAPNLIIGSDIKDNLIVSYEKKSISGGIISWYEKVREDKLSTDLYIHTANGSFDKIFINGIEYHKGE